MISPLGVLLSSEMFPATEAGYGELLAWAGRFGLVRRAGVECTGSYGAALARHLRAAGIEVIEVNQPDKATRRRQGKTDTLDAALGLRRPGWCNQYRWAAAARSAGVSPAGRCSPPRTRLVLRSLTNSASSSPLRTMIIVCAGA